MRGPYDARTGIARGTHGVLRIINPNHKYAAVSSRTGPVAWCDQGNSTDVRFLRELHLALRTRNRTGDKNRTGPEVGCDWGINDFFDSWPEKRDTVIRVARSLVFLGQLI